MFRKIFAVALLSILLGGFFAPAKAPAMDPVTIAVLAPVAVKAAEVMMPYIMRGLQCAGFQLLKMGGDLIEIFKLPLGVLQATLGAPLGMFSDGLANMLEGCIAPLKFTWHTVTLPITFVGITPD